MLIINGITHESDAVNYYPMNCKLTLYSDLILVCFVVYERISPRPNR